MEKLIAQARSAKEDAARWKKRARKGVVVSWVTSFAIGIFATFALFAGAIEWLSFGFFMVALGFSILGLIKGREHVRWCEKVKTHWEDLEALYILGDIELQTTGIWPDWVTADITEIL